MQEMRHFAAPVVRGSLRDRVAEVAAWGATVFFAGRIWPAVGMVEGAVVGEAVSRRFSVAERDGAGTCRSWGTRSSFPRFPSPLPLPSAAG